MDPEPPTSTASPSTASPSTSSLPTSTAVPAGSPPPLLRWVSPTRGYVLVAVIAGAVLLIAGLTWQTWLLLGSSGPSARGGGGWSVASMVVLVVAVVVLVELSRRPQPRAVGPRDRARQARARTRPERKIVRRAMWLGRLPAQPRLQRAAAHRVEPAAGNVLIVPLYLLFAAAALGVAAGRGDQALSSSSALIGAVWTVGALLILAMLVWLRRQARRLQRAWDADHAAPVNDDVSDTGDRK